MQLVFATNNQHKVIEINQILAEQIPSELKDISVVTMKEIGHTTDLPETHETILENAIEKATFLNMQYYVSCFSEDTGLEIDALGGKPGVHTAHYSGSRDPKSNIDCVLKEMGDAPKRSARFRTVICLILDGQQHIFEGICEGTIRNEPSGTQGFGYDPIFQPEGYDKTFAELPFDIKNTISHRGKAMQKLIDFLKNSRTTFKY